MEQKEDKKLKKCPCTICGKKYINKYCLRKHLQYMHKIYDQKCKICQDSFKSFKSLRSHEKVVHRIGVSSCGKFYICGDCHKQYQGRWRCIRHINVVHCKKTEHYECVCGKTFQTRTGMRLHSRTHMGLPRQNISLMECDHCGLRFSHTQRLIKHIFSFHENANLKMNFRCALCQPEFSTFKKVLIFQHYREQHKLDLSVKTQELADEDEFKRWKTDVEESAKCRYIKYHHYVGGNKKYTLFRCHRSGNFRAKGTGQRSFRFIGSEKINAFCPSEIRLEVDNMTGVHKVSFTKLHLGHKEGFEFIRPDIKLRGIIYEKIDLEDRKLLLTDSPKLKVDDSVYVQDSIHNNNVDRGISKSPHSILMKNWVAENRDCILYCRWPGHYSDEEYPNLADSDFVLIMMDEFQKDYLRKFGNNVIMVDGTRNFTVCGLELFALMVLDNSHQGILTSFMLANRTDEDIVQIFFTEIKKQVGLLRPKILMSDVHTVFADTWKVCHDVPEKHLYCSWSVNRAWKRKLSLIKGSPENKAIMKDMIQELQTEMNPVLFHEKLDHLLQINSPHFVNFVQFFETTFAKRYMEWAYYCRQFTGVNTTTFLKRFFKEVKKEFISYTDVDDLYEVAVILAHIVKNIQNILFLRVKKGSLTTKIKTLRLFHNYAVKEENRKNHIIPLDERKWYVPSSKFTEDDITFDNMYLIEQVIDKCGCKLRCRLCNACLHMYRCPCVTYSIDFHMCKHIHILCLWRNERGDVCTKSNFRIECQAVSADKDTTDAFKWYVGFPSRVTVDPEINREDKLEEYEPKIMPEEVCEESKEFTSSIIEELRKLKDHRNMKVLKKNILYSISSFEDSKSSLS